MAPLIDRSQRTSAERQEGRIYTPPPRDNSWVKWIVGGLCFLGVLSIGVGVYIFISVSHQLNHAAGNVGDIVDRGEQLVEQGTNARKGEWEKASLSADYTLRGDTLAVEERIAATRNKLSSNGLLRSLGTRRTQLNIPGARSVRLTGLHVTADIPGRPGVGLPASAVEVGGDIRIIIDDAKFQHTGLQSFVVSYTLKTKRGNGDTTRLVIDPVYGTLTGGVDSAQVTVVSDRAISAASCALGAGTPACSVDQGPRDVVVDVTTKSLTSQAITVNLA